MMETTQHWEGDDFVRGTKRSIWPLLTFWNPLVDALMRARAIEVQHVLREDTPQVRLTHDHEVIQAVASDAAQQPLADRVRSRCLDRCSEDLDAVAGGSGIEKGTVRGISIAHEVRRRLTEGRCLAQLLRDPSVCR